MSKRSDFGVGGQTRLAALTISETFWGYVIRETEEGFDARALAESGMRFLGLILIVAAFAQWLLPGALLGDDVLPMKLALMFALIAFGAGIYWYGDRAYRNEVEIDTTRRELRIMGRNGRGQGKLHKRIPMAEVESAYVKRTGNSGLTAHLLFRLRGDADPMHLATGEEAELRVLHARLCRDLQPAKERMERRMARETRTAPRARRLMSQSSTA